MTAFSRRMASRICLAVAFLVPVGEPARRCRVEMGKTGNGRRLVYGQRMHHAMAFDKDREGGDVTVFFGGEIGKEGEQTSISTTLRIKWNQLGPVTIIGPKPPTRSLHAMAYDPDRKQIIMAGGWNGDTHFQDTWIYTNERGIGYWTKDSRMLPIL